MLPTPASPNGTQALHLKPSSGILAAGILELLDEKPLVLAFLAFSVSPAGQNLRSRNSSPSTNI
jgi:hypothetical protein